ncbi:hemoglobin-like flavoprotein [Methylophilaceae bacterium 11]|nr:hemoglobin-like flavoprotein [Methylophilaceae bacterium 11]
MLSPAAKPYIEASVPVLREHGLAITTVFYSNMLAAHPELYNLFNLGNQANGSQQQSLASAVFAYAANIDNQAALTPVIERIVHKHVSIGILPDHYPIVGKYLLGAIKQVLGDAATLELMAAWDEAYWLLASALIAAEARLYAANDGVEQQWMQMVVTHKAHITEDMIAITLEPEQHQKLPTFKPGQYVSVAVHLDALNVRQIRQYSLSDVDDGQRYRITVKREKGDEFKPNGMISHWLHQHVRVGSKLNVSHPYGTFVPDLDKVEPIHLISAGVGITPMISILKTLASKQAKRKVVFAHAARTVHHIPHLSEIEQAKTNNPQLALAIFLNQQTDHQYIQGRMDLKTIVSKRDLEGDYYICGPIAFMNDQWKTLVELGVDASRINREVFGPESLNHLL